MMIVVSVVHYLYPTKVWRHKSQLTFISKRKTGDYRGRACIDSPGPTPLDARHTKKNRTVIPDDSILST